MVYSSLFKVLFLYILKFKMLDCLEIKDSEEGLKNTFLVYGLQGM
jgi:hypothetical protein